VTSLLLRLDIPQRIFERGLGHVVPADGAKSGRDVGCTGPFPLEAAGNQEVAQNVPGGFRSFVAVERPLARRNFPPAGEPAGVDADEHDLPVGGPAETGFKKMHQGQMNFPDF